MELLRLLHNVWHHYDKRREGEEEDAGINAREQDEDDEDGCAWCKGRIELSYVLQFCEDVGKCTVKYNKINRSDQRQIGHPIGDKHVKDLISHVSFDGGALHQSCIFRSMANWWSSASW
jgi:hypothetical protein